MQNLEALNLQGSKMEKEALLKEVTPVIELESLSISLIKNIVIAIAISLVMLLPKIYISNEVYLTSIHINKLLNKYYSLKAEHTILASKLEKIKFKNRLNY